MSHLKQIISNLGHLTADELLTLNRAVCSEIRFAQTREAHAIRATLSVGDTVSFSGKKGKFTGAIQKINRKNAKVKVVHPINGTTIWNVPMNLLTAA